MPVRRVTTFLRSAGFDKGPHSKGVSMQLGMIGLGKMGSNMAIRLLRGKHKVVVYDRSQDALKASVNEGATAAKDIKELVKKLDAPRTVWVMLPAGEVTENT